MADVKLSPSALHAYEQMMKALDMLARTRQPPAERTVPSWLDQQRAS